MAHDALGAAMFLGNVRGDAEPEELAETWGWARELAVAGWSADDVGLMDEAGSVLIVGANSADQPTCVLSSNGDIIASIQMLLTSGDVTTYGPRRHLRGQIGSTGVSASDFDRDALDRIPAGPSHTSTATFVTDRAAEEALR